MAAPLGSLSGFLLGLVSGLVLATTYVRLDLALPDWLDLPARLKGNLISSAIEDRLYDLDAPDAEKKRALEVYFAKRAKDAAAHDAAAGHPFLAALHAERARREARELIGVWQAAAITLDKPALRVALERKHATSDAEALKRAMLSEQLTKRPFLAQWLEATGRGGSGGDLLARLRLVAREPDAARR